MQRPLLLLTGLALMATVSQAQLAELHDLDGNNVNGQLIVHWGDAMTANQEVDVEVTLNGTSQKEINVRRYELQVVPNSSNYFCWGVCYIPQDAGALPVWQAEPQHSLMLSPGVGVDNFHAYHSPNGNLGTSIYRYVWFDVASPNDSVWVDIQFEATGVGIAERNGVEEFSVFPNPSVGRTVNVSFALAGDVAGLSLVVHDALGQPVSMQPLLKTAGRVQLDTQAYPPGVYFATLQRNGVLLSTERLVIGQ